MIKFESGQPRDDVDHQRDRVRAELHEADEADQAVHQGTVYVEKARTFHKRKNIFTYL